MSVGSGHPQHQAVTDDRAAEIGMRHAGQFLNRQQGDIKESVSSADVNNTAEGRRAFKRHPKPDENSPERPPSAYVLFFNDMRLLLKHKYLPFTEIADIVGETWQNLNPSKRRSYEMQATIAKRKYISDLAEYKLTDEHRKYSEYLIEFKSKQGIIQNSVRVSATSATSHHDWQEGQWHSDVPMSAGRCGSNEFNENNSSMLSNSDISSDHLPFKVEASEDFDVEMLDYTLSTHPPSRASQPTSRQCPRPRIRRSYDSSSGSSASTLMTPRDALSLVGSGHSPSFVETSDWVPQASPFHLNHFASNLAKDVPFGDFPTNSEFRFTSLPARDSPEPRDPEWFLEDYEAQGQLPIYPSHDLTEFKPPKENRKQSRDRNLKQMAISARNGQVPGAGIISVDGNYQKGTIYPSKSRSRHGPLSPEQAQHAALIRRHGACNQCRKRKVKCTMLHCTGLKPSPSATPPPRDKTPAFPSVVLALTIIRRSMERKHVKQMILQDIPHSSIWEQISRQTNCFENMTLQGLDLQSLLTRSREITESSDTNSINSFEDDFTEYSHGDSALCFAEQAHSAGPEDLVAAIQPLLNRLPSELSSNLGTELLSLFRIWLADRNSYQQTPHDGTPSSSNSHNPQGNTPTPTNSTGSGQKRLSDDGSGYSNPSGNSGDGNRKRSRNNSQTPSGFIRRWACPYHQRDPYSHCVEGDFGDYRKCAKSPGFSEVHRVKQHLYDCHAAIYCTRCYSQFKTKEELVAHLRNTLSCDVRDPQPLQGLNEDQKKSLKPRDRTKSEEERWKTVYRICFPSDRIIPSPYYVHYTQETARLRSQVFQIVDEETMFVDIMTRERLLSRLQNVFDRDAQNLRPGVSPIQSSRTADYSTNDRLYLSPNTTLGSNNNNNHNPPWSPWETRHTDPGDDAHVEDVGSDPLIVDNDDDQIAEPNVESGFFVPDYFNI